MVGAGRRERQMLTPNDAFGGTVRPQAKPWSFVTFPTQQEPKLALPAQKFTATLQSAASSRVLDTGMNGLADGAFNSRV